MIEQGRQVAPVAQPARVSVEVWSDVVCPWCWIGEERLAQVAQSLGLEGDLDIRVRSFELAPGRQEKGPLLETLGRKFGGPARLQQMQQQMAQLGEPLGLTFDFEKAISASSFDAHRVVQLANERGHGPALLERLHRAYFAEGADISDQPTLLRLAAEVGLPEADVTAVLADETYAQAVRDDEEMARAYGVSGVPFFVFGRRYAVEGAQPAEVFAEALRRVRAEQAPLQRLSASSDGAAAVCVDDTCALPGEVA